MFASFFSTFWDTLTRTVAHPVNLEHLFQLIIAGLLGACIGYERERRGQAAGFRTNILVAVGACLMMQLSLYMEEMFRPLNATLSVTRVDPGRIASYALASIGFVGGGAIIKGKGSVRGLTTAASLWLVTGLGLAVGAGLILPAAMGTVFITAILFWMPGFLRHLPPRKVLVSITVVFREHGQYRHDELVKIISGHHSFVSHTVGFEADTCSEITTYRFRVMGKENGGWTELYEELSMMDDVCRVAFEESPIP